MNWGKLAASAAVGLGMLAVGATSASAAEISFASFSAIDNPNVALANNGGGGVTLTATTGFGSPNVTFGFVNPLGFGLVGTTQTLAFSLTATSFGNATATPIGPFTFDSQSFSGSFAYVYNGAATTINGVPLTSGETLLSGTFTASLLTGMQGGDNSALTSVFEASNVNYSSPFFTFVANSDSNSFSFDMNNVSPHFGITGNNLSPFTATMSGNFSTDDAIHINCLPGQVCVPEPITLSLFGAGLAGAAAFRRRRKTAVKA